MLLQKALFHSFLYSIVYMYHIFFIHSSIDEHLGCFHVLSIVNEHWGACFLSNYGFLWMYAQKFPMKWDWMP